MHFPYCWHRWLFTKAKEQGGHVKLTNWQKVKGQTLHKSTGLNVSVCVCVQKIEWGRSMLTDPVASITCFLWAEILTWWCCQRTLSAERFPYVETHLRWPRWHRRWCLLQHTNQKVIFTSTNSWVFIKAAVGCCYLLLFPRVINVAYD